jgi:hypothetical protein
MPSTPFRFPDHFFEYRNVRDCPFRVKPHQSARAARICGTENNPWRIRAIFGGRRRLEPTAVATKPELN